ncbi:unnamed protein product [Mytilus coruscus]|uniref:Nuclear apoptosis-inducing factor 1 n=1 Tax=Mytilus coruscus TaxID=42192 RepID=A0A6J8DLU0_MYTCO|nr:unnamed protein product [Mytilus coruscus]
MNTCKLLLAEIRERLQMKDFVKQHKYYWQVVKCWTNNIKKKTWDGICTKINSSNTHHQKTVEEIWKKWTTYISNAKNKVAHNRREAGKTGGGPPPEDISSMEDQVEGTIGDTPIDGIDGGTDTGAFTETSMHWSMLSCSSSRRSFFSSADEADCHYEFTECLTCHFRSFNQWCYSNTTSPTKHITPSTSMEDNDSNQLIQIVKTRLDIEKERLQVEKDTLRLKEER